MPSCLQWLLAIRAVVGFALGGNPIAVTLFAEFLPSEQRGRWLFVMQSFWSVGEHLVVSHGQCGNLLAALAHAHTHKMGPTLREAWALLWQLRLPPAARQLCIACSSADVCYSDWQLCIVCSSAAVCSMQRRHPAEHRVRHGGCILTSPTQPHWCLIALTPALDICLPFVAPAGDTMLGLLLAAW